MHDLHVLYEMRDQAFLKNSIQINQSHSNTTFIVILGEAHYIPFLSGFLKNEDIQSKGPREQNVAFITLDHLSKKLKILESLKEHASKIEISNIDFLQGYIKKISLWKNSSPEACSN